MSSLYKTGNSVPSSAMPDVWDNNRVQDGILNSSELEVETRTGDKTPTWRGVLKQNADAIKETQDSITILGLPFATLADAQAAADAGKIPVGAVTWTRSSDDDSLADECINNGGIVETTGRIMASKEYIDKIKNRVPIIDRSLYWGGIVAKDGTIGVVFRESDNRPIFGNGGDILSIFPQYLRTGFWGGIVANNDMVGVVFRESDNRPFFGNGGDIVGRIEKLEQFNPITTAIAHAWGNSKTAGAGGTPYPTQLAALIGNGFTANNYGIGGQKSGQIAMRMGAMPTYITVEGDTIPAANAAVTITQINGVSATAAPAYPSQDVRLLSTTADNVTRTIDGWLCGVKCRITRTASGDNNNTKVEVYTLTALTGTGVRCLPGSLFVPDYALQDHSGVEMWIDAGINDFRSGTDADLTDDVEAIRRNVDAMVDFSERCGGNIIILSLTADNYSTEYVGGIRYARILELNNYWSQKYPNYYARGNNGLDLRETLVANYNPAIAQDVIDYGNDITPSSLRSDDRHPNTTGYGIYASVAYEFRKRRGY